MRELTVIVPLSHRARRGTLVLVADRDPNSSPSREGPEMEETVQPVALLLQYPLNLSQT